MPTEDQLQDAFQRAREARAVHGHGHTGLVSWLESQNIEPDDLNLIAAQAADAFLTQVADMGGGVPVQQLMRAIWMHGYQNGWTASTLYSGVHDTRPDWRRG